MQSLFNSSYKAWFHFWGAEKTSASKKTLLTKVSLAASTAFNNLLPSSTSQSSRHSSLKPSSFLTKIVLALIGSETVRAQTTFMNTYVGAGYDQPTAVVSTSDGGFIVGGLTSQTVAGTNNALLVRIGADRELLWANEIGEEYYELSTGLIKTSDDSFLMIGSTANDYFRKSLAFFTKWNETGSPIWAKLLEMPVPAETRHWTSANAAVLTPDNGMIVVGGRTRLYTSESDTDLLLLRIDNNGTISWLKTIGGTKNEWITGLTSTFDEGVATAGSTYSFGAGDADIFITKWWINGTLCWIRTMGGKLQDDASAISSTQAGDLVVAGYTLSFGTGGSDIIVSQWTLEGELIWVKALGGAFEEAAYSLQISPEGSIYVLGYTTSFGRSLSAGLITEWSLNGTLIHAKTIGGVNYNLARATLLNPDGSLVVAGDTKSFGAGDSDIFLAQVTSRLQMANCSYLKSAPPTVTNLFNSILVTTPNLSPTTWDNYTVSDWDNMTVNASTLIRSEQCQELDASNLTESSPQVFPSGSVPESPGNSASSPSSSKASSNKTHLTIPLPVILGAAGGGVFLVAGGSILAIYLKKRKKPASSAPIELPAAHVGAKKEEIPERPSSSVDVRIEAKTVIGKKYGLVRKITVEEANALKLQTGIEITFPAGVNKTKPLIGAGRFGKLRIAQNVLSKEFVGVKKIKGKDEITASMQEASLQKQLSGLPNLMPILDSVETIGSNGEPVLYQFMPLAGFGNGETLQAALPHQPIEIKRKLLGHVTQSVLKGLAGMHGKQIAHLDLKNSNIVLSQEGELFIIDFGCAMQASNLRALTEGNGDTFYFSPGRIAYYRSFLETDPHIMLPTSTHYSGTTADLWALGMLLLELTHNRYPLEPVDIRMRINTWDLEIIYTQLEPYLSNSEYTPLTDLIRKLLAEDPLTSAADLLNDPLFSNPSYMFESPEELSTVFKKLKTPSNPPIKPTDYLKKSEDKKYVKSHYPKKKAVPHVYEDSAEPKNTFHKYENE